MGPSYENWEHTAAAECTHSLQMGRTPREVGRVAGGGEENSVKSGRPRSSSQVDVKISHFSSQGKGMEQCRGGESHGR